MRIVCVVVLHLALMPAAVIAQGRSFGGTRRGVGLVKKNHLKDWRTTSQLNSSPTQQPVIFIPTQNPTKAPTRAPTLEPSTSPTGTPTSAPVTFEPTAVPTKLPSRAPTAVPTIYPTTSNPTDSPSRFPTSRPSQSPTTPNPTESPTRFPTLRPSQSPTSGPTQIPTVVSDHADTCLALDAPFLFEDYSMDIEVDVNEDGFITLGDVITFTNELSIDDGNDGVVVVGTSSGRCIYTFVAGDVLYCVFEHDFTDGTVLIQGIFDAAGLQRRMVVTEGTGCYAGLKGYLLLVGETNNTARYEYLLMDKAENCTFSDENIAGPWFANGFLEGLNGFALGDVFISDAASPGVGQGFEGIVDGECMVINESSNTLEDSIFCTVSFAGGPELRDIVTAQGTADSMVITAGLGCFSGKTGTLSISPFDGESILNPNFDSVESSTSTPCSLDVFDELWTVSSYNLVDYVEYLPEPAGAGNVYTFHKIPLIGESSLGDVGIVSGRCFFLSNETSSDDETYCNFVFMLDGGSIAVQGYDNIELVILGGSGCFSNLTGYASIEFRTSDFLYNWFIDT